MPTFMQSLAANPSGSSGIYGQPGAGGGDEDVLSLVNRIKDREMQDYKDKANFMSDLSLKQDRLRRIYDSMEPNMMTPKQQGGMNVVMGQDPNQMTGFQKGELGIRQQELAQGNQRLAQQQKLGQEALDIKTAQEKLNQQKSDQINASKQADHELKVKEAQDKVRAAEEKMRQAGENFEARLAAQKEHAAAVEAYHNADTARREHEFSVTHETNLKKIKDQEEQLKQRGRTKTTTAISPEGTSKTVTTERGSAAGRVRVTGKDGQTYEIPEDKLPEWNSQHAPEESSEEQQ